MIPSFKKKSVILFSGLSLLAACKKDKDSNTAPVQPLTYYTAKGTQDANSNITYQLVSLDPTTLAESVIYNMKDTELTCFVYSPVTKEIMALDFYGVTLIKVNPVTKQKTTIVLTSELNINFSELVIDKENNLYAIKRESNSTSGSTNTLVKIDAATGKVTPLNNVRNVYSLAYLPLTNEIVGLIGNTGIAKYNLTSQDTSSAILSTSTQDSYNTLFTDQSNFYTCKMNTSTKVSEIVKFDPATLAESTVTTLSDYSALRDSKITYIPQRNELVSIWKDVSFYKYELGQKSTSVTALSTDPKVWYYNIITN